MKYTLVLHDLAEVIHGDYESYENFEDIILIKKDVKQKQ